MSSHTIILATTFYAIIVTSALATFWLTEWLGRNRPFFVVALAALATGVVWEGFNIALTLSTIGQVALHAYGHGATAQYVLLPLFRIALGSLVALPVALAMHSYLRRYRHT
jgi:hypothetical protein